MWLYLLIPHVPHLHMVQSTEHRGTYAYQRCRCGQGRVRRYRSGHSPVAVGWSPFWGPVPPEL